MAGRKMCGGTSEVKDATDEIKAFCEEVKEEVLQKLNQKEFETFKVIQYKSQIVGGTNYFVKIQVNNSGECIHVRIFEPLPCNRDANSNRNVELSDVAPNKQLDEDIAYF